VRVIWMLSADADAGDAASGSILSGL
jgi:hypothetical protein